MKLLAGIFCLAIVTCEAKAVELNRRYGTKDNPVLLLEAERSMTLSHSSAEFPLTYWVSPDGDHVACNNTMRSGRISVICENGYSNLTVSKLATCDTGNYNFHSSKESFEFKVEIIKVSVTASMDDGCNFVNIVAHIESTNYEIIAMTSPYSDTAIHQFRHPFHFSIMNKNPGDLGGSKWNTTITIRRKNTNEDHNLNQTVNAADKCCPTAKSCNDVSSPIVQPAASAHSSSVTSKASAFLLMGFFVFQILLFV